MNRDLARVSAQGVVDGDALIGETAARVEADGQIAVAELRQGLQDLGRGEPGAIAPEIADVPEQDKLAVDEKTMRHRQTSVLLVAGSVGFPTCVT